MIDTIYDLLPMTAQGPVRSRTKADWLWSGYLARRSVTLLTSQWKCGKTTLVSGLLKALGPGNPFLGRPCRPAKAIVVSEESHELWAERLDLMPAGEHARLLPRPFRARPSPSEWQNLLDMAVARAGDGDLDLFVVDPLASFLPTRAENNAGMMLDALQPLQPVAAAGVAVLLLHHPKKAPAEEGCTARGSGALSGFVDILLELSRFGRLPSDDRRRKIGGFSRFAETPRQLYYTWNPANGAFDVVADPHDVQFKENWGQLLMILKGRETAATHLELLADWPVNQPPPSRTTLYAWLNQATGAKLVRRAGQGTKANPFRYRLPSEDDEYYDRGELPPLKPFEWI